MAAQEQTLVTVLVHCQQRTRPVTFMRVPTTPDLHLLQTAAREVFKDVPKVNVPGSADFTGIFVFKFKGRLGWTELERAFVVIMFISELYKSFCPHNLCGQKDLQGFC